MTFAISLPHDVFWVPLLAGAFAALVVTAIQILTTPLKSMSLSIHEKDRSAKHKFYYCPWLAHPVYTASTWSFKDSWATNVTAIGAVLGTVTGSTTFFPSASGAANPNALSFITLFIFLGGAAGLSPLIYASLAVKPPHNHPDFVSGTVGGLLLANTVTLFATLGELATVGMIVDVSSVTTGERILLIAALAFAAFFVIVYAIRSFWALAQAKQPSPSTGTPSHSTGKASLMNPDGNSATL
jgi:hypothetical protein